MSVKITRLETRIVEHPLNPQRIIVGQAGKHDVSRFLLVAVHGSDGLRGFGEAATTPLWSGESAESAQMMVERYFAPVLIGRSIDDPSRTVEMLDGLTVGNSFAKGAVDTAVWDLFARSRGVPVSALIADRPPAASIPSRASVGAYPVEQTLRLAREFWEAGIRVLKFKTGAMGVDDVARLRAVREALGDEPVFTVDYNGAFREVTAAVKAIEALEPFNLALVEQPTHRERIDLMAEVRRRVRPPILADEAIFTPDHLAAALDQDAFDYLSIYPGKNGGFTHSWRMAQTAWQAGKPCTIGCNLESDLGQASMACLAASLSAFPTERLASDLPAKLFYHQSSVIQPLSLEGGQLYLPQGAGFGVEPLWEA